MTESSISPGWSIGPGWSLSEGMGGTDGGSNYYYYINLKKKKPRVADVNDDPVVYVDWSQAAVDEYNLELRFRKVMAESKRLGFTK